MLYAVESEWGLPKRAAFGTTTSGRAWGWDEEDLVRSVQGLRVEEGEAGVDRTSPGTRRYERI